VVDAVQLALWRRRRPAASWPWPSFEWIETCYELQRHHSYCEMLSPVDFEARAAEALAAVA
jgi:hypothetical protein